MSDPYEKLPSLLQMLRVVEHKYVFGSSKEKLFEKLNTYITEGWAPLGPLYSRAEGTLWFVMLVRWDPYVDEETWQRFQEEVTDTARHWKALPLPDDCDLDEEDIVTYE